VTAFDELFGDTPEIQTHANGRINLIGEHTDYNGGFVLPLLIPQKTEIELRSRKDRSVRVFSESKPGDGICRYELGSERYAGEWLDYIRGITWILNRDGHRISGFDARIESKVPVGSGVSSSAALEVSLLRALRLAFDLPIDDVALALTGQRAENEFVGARVGIMDQMVASLGSEDAALFLDTKSLEHRLIPLPSALEMAVLHSGISHSNREGGYNKRREECERAASLLHVTQLRDLDIQDLPRVERLPEPERRRVLHVITENARVLQAVKSLELADLSSFGKLLNQSHISMRDDYEVSIPEIDLLVDLAQRATDVYGARMTGGGFGGSIIIGAKTGSAHRIASEVASEYTAKSGRHARVLMPVKGE
jgi:galactokinase